jgi:hypothetical protein
MRKSIWFWLFAIAITLMAIVFQRQTGPTYPKTVSFQVDDSISINLKLPRSNNIDEELRFELPPLSWDWTVRLYHRPFPKDTAWILNPPFWPEGNAFVSYLPSISQKAAKLEYFIEFENYATGEIITIPEDEPVVIRYKGSVPAWALIPHIVFIFIALIFSNLSALLAVFKNNRFKFWGVMTLAFMFLGGLIFGPIVQKFAFDHYWTGFPFGHDLTDNKTLIMFVVWAIAVIANWKKDFRWLTIVAAIVTIIVYLIPHSLRGSEFNYESGEIVTGTITFFNSIF